MDLRGPEKKPETKQESFLDKPPAVEKKQQPKVFYWKKLFSFSFLLLSFCSIFFYLQGIFDDMKDDDLFSSPPKKDTSNVGKLKTTIAIDPKAFMPGSTPPVKNTTSTPPPSFDEPGSFFLLPPFFFPSIFPFF